MIVICISSIKQAQQEISSDNDDNEEDLLKVKVQSESEKVIAHSLLQVQCSFYFLTIVANANLAMHDMATNHIGLSTFLLE